MIATPVATAEMMAQRSATDRAGKTSRSELTPTNTTAGSPLSTSPRLPPSCSTSAGPSGCSPEMVRSSSTGSAASPGASGTGGAQLVGRVVDGRPAVLVRQPAAGDERAAGLDAADPPAPQPDQRDGAGAVVQLRLERRHAGARPQHHRAQLAGDADRRPHGAPGHMGRSARGPLRLQLATVQLLLVGGEPREGATEPAGLLVDCGHAIRVRARQGPQRPQRVSVISGPRSGISRPAAS